MKTYTWKNGRLFDGLKLTEDDRFGLVVFLGEPGRGRWFEKIALGRKAPAEAIDGRVHEARLVTITLPPQGSRPAKSFHVLEAEATKNEDKVLIRVNTEASYIRGARGRHEVVEGSPTQHAAGHGAYGAAGRTGTWSDSLVEMSTSDVLRVRPTRSVDGHAEWALWLEDGVPKTAPWPEYRTMKAVENGPSELAFGEMPCFTVDHDGEAHQGITVAAGQTGPAVVMGEAGRGRRQEEIPVVNARIGDSLYTAAVAVLGRESRQKSWGGSEEVVTYGLTQADTHEDNHALVRVQHRQGHRTVRYTAAHQGKPVEIAGGNFASGAAGRAGSTDDTLWVLGEGDALVVNGSAMTKLHVIAYHRGRVTVTPWETWENATAAADPERFVRQGKAPWGHVPADWIGSVVFVEGDPARGKYEAELISVEPFVLNLGWREDHDRCDVEVTKATWVSTTHKKVVVVSDEVIAERERLKGEITAIETKMAASLEAEHFGCFHIDLRERIKDAAEGRAPRRHESSAPGEVHELRLKTLWELNVIHQARHELAELVNEATPKAVERHRQFSAGEILVDFGGNFRTGGATNLRRYWVITPDGNEREFDFRRYKRRSNTDGQVRWDVVEPDELALVYHKDDTADDHHCEVVKFPVGGVTEAQITKAAQIAADLGAKPDAFRVDPLVVAAAETRLKEVRRAYEELPAHLQTRDGSWLKEWTDKLLCSSNGVLVSSQFEGTGGFMNLVYDDDPFEDSVEGREAQVVEYEACAGGELEFLVYHKWEDWNLNMRWIELKTENDTA